MMRFNSRATGDEHTQARQVSRGEAVESAQSKPVRMGEVEVKRW
jgi:hypothetical protein